jgi:Bacteriophage baseplate protein W
MSISTGPGGPPVSPGNAADRLGVGVAFPFVPDSATGSLTWSSGAALVRQSIRLILATAPAERVMRPTFGAGLRRYLMDPNTPAIRAQIALDVQAALQTWEPRITVTSVDVAPGADPAEALITVRYVHVRDLSPDSVTATVPTSGTAGGTP